MEKAQELQCVYLNFRPYNVPSLCVSSKVLSTLGLLVHGSGCTLGVSQDGEQTSGGLKSSPGNANVQPAWS